jgi:hypothetical protein
VGRLQTHHYRPIHVGACAFHLLLPAEKEFWQIYLLCMMQLAMQMMQMTPGTKSMAREDVLSLFNSEKK